MKDAIELHNIDLKFEYEGEMLSTNPKQDEFCDDIENEFRKYKDSGLLIHDYE